MRMRCRGRNLIIDRQRTRVSAGEAIMHGPRRRRLIRIKEISRACSAKTASIKNVRARIPWLFAFHQIVSLPLLAPGIPLAPPQAGETAMPIPRTLYALTLLLVAAALVTASAETPTKLAVQSPPANP